MTTITTRTSKGSALSWAEADANFDNLNTDKAELASPTFTGVPAAPTAVANTNTTQLATTAFVTTADNLKANLASPALTGTPTAPTATTGTNTTQLATTAFVQGKTATQTPFTAVGNIVATDVQAAIAELDTDKASVVQLEAATEGPAFLATGTSQSLSVNVSTKATITTEVFDTNNNYDTSNSRFTPTVAGYYQVNADGGNQAALDTFGIYIIIVKNNAGAEAQGGSTGNAVTYARGQASCLVYMNGTTDYLEVFLTGTGPSGSVTCICDHFSACLVRPA